MSFGGMDMDLVNFSLSAVGLLLGFSLASLITVLMEWMKNDTGSNASEDEKGNSSRETISSGTAIIDTSKEKKQNFKQKAKFKYFNKLFYPLTYKNSELPLDEIINILKIVSSLFVIVFWTLLVTYLKVGSSLNIEDPILYQTVRFTYYVLPIVGLELLLLILLKIRMKTKALLSTVSHIVVLISMIYIILISIIAIIK